MRRGRRGRAASWVQVAAGREYIGEPRTHSCTAAELGVSVKELVLRPSVSKKLRAAASDGTYEEGEFTQLGGTSVLAACIYAYCSPVFQLVQGGANVTVSDTKGRTALHFAACRGDANMGGWTPEGVVTSSSCFAVKLLISYGASVNQKDSNGNTPLHLGEQKCCSPDHLMFSVINSVLYTPLWSSHCSTEGRYQNLHPAMLDSGRELCVLCVHRH